MAKKKAKNPSNQAALDRMQEIHEKTASTKYIHTVKRAISSLAACPDAITTRKQALELRYVGPHMAKVICPEEAVAAKPISGANKKRKATSDTSTEASSRAAARPLPASSSSSLSDTAEWKAQVSAKQLAYNKAVKDGSNLKIPSGPWKVVLLLDGREQRAEHVQAKLQMSGIPCEQRHLPIGDMAWMARSGDIELMLGTIVERKEVNDLAQSLFGTRYLEQRLRLQHCGLPQVLLLVEGNTSAVSNCPADTLHMAMMETRVRLGFQVVATPHLDNTVRFLKNVHRRILQRSFPSAFGDAQPTSLPSFTSPNASQPRRKKKKVSLVDMVMDSAPVPPLGQERCITYNELKTRVERDREAGTRTVGAIHAAMLKQMPTLSVKKVQAIQQAYPTPQALYQTYVGLEPSDGKTLVQDFTTNTGRERTCRVGPKSALEVYHMCTEGASAHAVMEQAAQMSKGDSGVACSTGGDADQWEVSPPSAARMPDEGMASVEKSFSFPPFDQDFDASPPGHDRTIEWFSQGESNEWSQVSDSKPAAIPNSTRDRWESTSPHRPLYTRQTSPTSPIEEIDLALRLSRQDYLNRKSQAVEEKRAPSQDDGFVDLTQGCDSDADVRADYWLSDASSPSAIAVLENGDDGAKDDLLHESPTMNAANASSQGSSSIDDDNEPLYVRCQRLHQAREAVESQKRKSNDQVSSQRSQDTMEVIEIE